MLEVPMSPSLRACRFLKEKKQKQKQSKKDYEEVIEIGGTTEFPTVSAVKFGEVADRPPEFQFLPKPKVHINDQYMNTNISL